MVKLSAHPTRHAAGRALERGGGVLTTSLYREVGFRPNRVYGDSRLALDKKGL